LCALHWSVFIRESAAQAVEAANALGLPSVLKTAEEGIAHKTELNGVKLRLADDASVISAWQDLSARIGPRDSDTTRAPAGVELALGVTIDRQFGPLVMVASGGVWIEILRDAQYAIAPFGPATALRLLNRLRIRPLLDGVRGSDAADLSKLADSIARLSVLAWDLRELIAEIDVNPIIATSGGAIALDSLVVPQPHSA
jgi:acyl-CoA synthetase (NDP forming)